MSRKLTSKTTPSRSNARNVSRRRQRCAGAGSFILGTGSFRCALGTGSFRCAGSEPAPSGAQASEPAPSGAQARNRTQISRSRLEILTFDFGVPVAQLLVILKRISWSATERPRQPAGGSSVITALSVQGCTKETLESSFLEASTSGPADTHALVVGVP